MLIERLTYVKFKIMKRFIAYYRVSTQKQYLGIDVQKSGIENYINSISGILVDAIEERESGKNDNRAGLEKAIKMCETHSATLIIFKLDRLSRSVSFLFQLRDRVDKSKIEIQALDMPTFNTLTLGIYATIGQAERELISSRTKSALSILKSSGKVLGSPQNLTTEAQQRGVDSIKLKARKNNQNRQALAIIISCLEEKNMNYSSTARYLNQLNFKTSKLFDFVPTSVMRLYQRHINEIKNVA